MKRADRDSPNYHNDTTTPASIAMEMTKTEGAPVLPNDCNSNGHRLVGKSMSVGSTTSRDSISVQSAYEDAALTLAILRYRGLCGTQTLSSEKLRELCRAALEECCSSEGIRNFLIPNSKEIVKDVLTCHDICGWPMLTFDLHFKKKTASEGLLSSLKRKSVNVRIYVAADQPLSCQSRKNTIAFCNENGIKIIDALFSFSMVPTSDEHSEKPKDAESEIMKALREKFGPRSS